MTKLDKLRAIVDAMTKAPWKWDDDGWYLYGPDGYLSKAIIETDAGVYGPSKPDRIGIEALRNSADDLLKVAEAVKRWSDAANAEAMERDPGKRRAYALARLDAADDMCNAVADLTGPDWMSE